MLTLAFTSTLTLSLLLSSCTSSVDGAQYSEVGIDASSVVESCGNGVIDTDEACDDGNNKDGDNCNSSCEYENCGDGTVQDIEECEGVEESDCNTTCGSKGTTTCSPLRCKYESCQPPVEACNTKDDDCDGKIDNSECLSEIFRFFNGETRQHKYATTSTPPEGSTLETVRFLVYTTSQAGTTPLYQKVNTSGTRRFLTLNKKEANDDGFSVESILGYVTSALSAPWLVGSHPAKRYCRYYNNIEDDRLVSFENQEDHLVTLGYQKEACLFWGWQ